jgi:hypothetical protein
MGSSVHFWGAANTVAMYRAREVAPWSMWQGNQFLFKYEGEDIEEGAAQLMKIFNSMAESTNALYTLKIYEELPKGGKINRTTPDHGSFNFRLNMDLQGLNQQQAQSVGNRAAMESEIAALKEELAELREELEEETDPPEIDIWEKINGILEKPAIVAGINKIFGLDIQPRAAAISGVPAPDGSGTIAQAIEILQQHDERLKDHLWKLALMAQQKPHNFKFLLSTLDTLQ